MEMENKNSILVTLPTIQCSSFILFSVCEPFHHRSILHWERSLMPTIKNSIFFDHPISIHYYAYNMTTTLILHVIIGRSHYDAFEACNHQNSQNKKSIDPI